MPFKNLGQMLARRVSPAGSAHKPAGWDFSASGGAMGAAMREMDWAATPLGPPSTWCEALKTLVNIMLCSSQPMFVAWGEERALLYNDPYREILADKHPALGKDFLEVFEEIRADLAPIVARAYAGEPTHMDDIALLLHRRGYPEQTHFSFSYTPIRGEEGDIRGLFCACAEITAQIVAERRIAEERQRYELMLTRMPGFVAFLAGPEHRYDYANEAYQALVGPRELMGRTVREVFPDLEGQGFFEILDRVYADGQPYTAQAAPVRFGGADSRREDKRFVDLLFHPMRTDDGRVGGIFVGGYDVTDQVTARGRLTAQQQRAKAVLDGMGEGFALFDRDMRLVDINAAGQRIEARPRESLIGRSHWELHPGSEDSELGRLYREALEKQCPVAREHRHTWPDGRALWLDMRAYPVPEGLAVFFRDITDRKEAEQRLREGETRFRNMADHAPVMMWVTEADGRCSYLNRAWYDFTGQSEEQALGFGWLEAVHPLDRGEAERIFMQATANHTTFRIEYRLRRADGSYRWSIDTAAPRFDGDGSFLGFIGSVVDIDERREAEERMRARSEELAAVLDAVPAVIWVAEDSEARTIRGNRQAADLLRLPAPDVNMSKTGPQQQNVAHFRVVDGEGRDLAGSDLPVQRAARGETVRNFEERVIFDDGSVVDLLGNAIPLRDGAGQLRGSVAAFVDITDRKRAEAGLQALNDQLEQRVATAVNERNRLWAVTDDLFVTADFEGRLLEFSESWMRILGWDREALLTMPYTDLIHPDDLPAVTQNLALLRQRDRSIAYENRVLTRDGTWRIVAWRLSADPEGARLYGVGRDVTAERDQARALAEAEKKLYEVQKMESIGQLTGGVAHDFNNLLSAILSNLDIARKGITDARTARLVEGAIKGAERGAALTKRLLAFARRQELRAEAVAVPALFADMQELLSRSLGPGVVIGTDFPPDLPPVCVDPNQLELALLNLAVNARDAMAQGGTLTVSASAERISDGTSRLWTPTPHAAPGQALEETLPEGHYVRIRVSDTGCGMDAATLKRAAEPFFTTKGVGKGTGLGLSMVQGLAAQSGGAMRVESEPGRGTTVELWLPQAAGAAAAALPSRTEAAGPQPQRPLTILVVDDDALVAMGTMAMLEDMGHTVLDAHSGRMALEMVAGNPDLDLVITDHAMPGMTGTELIRQLAARYPALPVVLATGYAELPNGEASTAPRLAKPLRQEELASVLDTLFAKSARAPARV